MNVPADTANAVDGLEFQDIPPGGALVSIYASTPVTTGAISFSIGRRRFLSGAEVNIEASADVVDTDRDAILVREPVPAGKMFLSTHDQVVNFIIQIEEP